MSIDYYKGHEPDQDTSSQLYGEGTGLYFGQRGYGTHKRTLEAEQRRRSSQETPETEWHPAVPQPSETTAERVDSTLKSEHEQPQHRAHRNSLGVRALAAFRSCIPAPR